MAVICIAVGTHKTLADKDDAFTIYKKNQELGFATLHFLVEKGEEEKEEEEERGFFERLFGDDDTPTANYETEPKSISILIKSFNSSMRTKMDTIKGVYQTRKSGKDRITFSALLIDEELLHNIECRITFSPDRAHPKVFFHNCGNKEFRFRDPVGIFYSHIRADEIIYSPNN